MKLKTMMLTSAAAVMATGAFAGGHMSDSLTIVSWGGAYSASQQAAYHDPYMEMTGITIVNDESSAEAVAKMRAMAE
ncbi:MAG: ABC transporter substrate-binding protein, partial [Pseudomonadota bacterium]